MGEAMARAGSKLFALIASLGLGAVALTSAVTVLGPAPTGAPMWSLAVVLTFVLMSDQAAAHVRIGRDTHSVTLGDMALASTALLLPVPVIVAAKAIGMIRAPPAAAQGPDQGGVQRGQ